MTALVILLAVVCAILVVELWHTRRRWHEAENDLEYVISGERRH